MFLISNKNSNHALDVLVLLTVARGFYWTVDGFEVSDFVLECPCLDSFEAPLGVIASITVQSCFATCMATDQCTAYTYCNLSSSCSLYSNEGTGLTMDSLLGHNCESHPSQPPETISSLKWHWIRFSPLPSSPLTTNCHYIKTQNPSLTDDYYTVHVRGRFITVFCKMDAVPEAETYIDLSAYSHHGGGGATFIENQATHTFSRARIILHDCFVFLDTRLQTHFVKSVNGHLWPEGKRIGQGGTCKGDTTSRAGRMEINLAGTPFQFPKWIQLSGTKMVTTTLTEQYAYAATLGACGQLTKHAIFDTQQRDLIDYIPLHIYSTFP
ncbi:uncharacterized protein LOC142335423 [Convolutriloba macropyga]|uniref:uncharacterized protein LOC142335423 n=1 Tax=Convolutriloba macropyga TaxID=536237 RepID=UPI003F51B837